MTIISSPTKTDQKARAFDREVRQAIEATKSILSSEYQGSFQVTPGTATVWTVTFNDEGLPVQPDTDYDAFFTCVKTPASIRQNSLLIKECAKRTDGFDVSFWDYASLAEGNTWAWKLFRHVV